MLSGNTDGRNYMWFAYPEQRWNDHDGIDTSDFLDLHFADYHWPAFNVPDAAISVGVGLMLLRMLQEWRQDRMAAAR